MAFLFVNTRSMELDSFTPTVGHLKANIAAVLVQSAFTQVVNTEHEVAGNRAGMRLSILHLPISGRRFYQQVMAAGDRGDATRALVDEIVRAISP